MVLKDFVRVLVHDVAHGGGHRRKSRQIPQRVQIRVVHVVPDGCSQGGGHGDQLDGSVDLADKGRCELGSGVRYVEITRQCAL